MVVDFFKPQIWLVFALGLLILTPLTHPSVRKWTLAGLNLLLIGAILWSAGWLEAASKVHLFLILIAGILLIWAALGILSRLNKPVLAATAFGVVVLALWLIHKLPRLSAVLHTGRLSFLMVTLGFSYVALRLGQRHQQVSLSFFVLNENKCVGVRFFICFIRQISGVYSIHDVE